MSLREKLVFLEVVCLILLMGFIQGCSYLTPEDKWWEERISYSVVDGNGTLEELWSRSDLFVRERGGRCLPFITAAQNKVFIIGNFEKPDNKAVLALDAVDGTLHWRSDNPDGYQLTGLEVTLSILYSGSGGNATLRAYDLKTGQILWSNSMPGSLYIDCFRVFDDLIIVETAVGSYFVQADTGKTLHKSDDFPTTDELEQLATQLGISTISQIKPEYFGDVVFSDDIVLRGDSATDLQTGNVLWQIEGVISNLAATPSAVYLLTKDRKLLGLDRRSGEIIASVQFEPIPTSIGTHGFDNAFYVAADEDAGMVYAFLGDGAQLFAFKIVN